MDAEGKTFDQWLFDLDEQLALKHLPMRSHDYDREALVSGFTQEQTPGEFLRTSGHLRKPEPTPTPPVMLAQPIAGQVALPGEDQKTRTAIEDIAKNVKDIRTIVAFFAAITVIWVVVAVAMAALASSR